MSRHRKGRLTGLEGFIPDRGKLLISFKPESEMVKLVFHKDHTDKEFEEYFLYGETGAKETNYKD